MSEFQFRPRCKVRTLLHPDAVIDRLRNQVRDDNPEGFLLTGNLPHLTLKKPAAVRRMWTPQMDMDLQMEQVPGAETRTVVRCLIGPAPSVWMGFMGMYLALFLFAVIALNVGIAQRMLGITAWALHATWALIMAGVAVWAVAQGGKRRARAEMVVLQQFVDRALGRDRLPPAVH
ncbi:MAG: hypothetical protein KBH07_04345 [Flavobacteriales bacterium]|nr:hypothetical protein [Flavobacteriales bacterium]MBP9079762.1 hypothetical protein [Flavobacteriales bacterium]